MEPLTINLDEYSCPNPDCSDHGQKHKGNISIRGTYGKDKRTLLYCRTCGKRFAATFGTAFYGAHISSEAIQAIIHHSAEGVGVRATARLLGIDRETVNDVILRVGTFCAQVLDGLLRSLSLTEVQLDELWGFIKKNDVMRLVQRTAKITTLRSLPKTKKMKSKTTTTKEKL